MESDAEAALERVFRHWRRIDPIPAGFTKTA